MSTVLTSFAQWWVLESDKLLKQFLYWIVSLCYAIYCFPHTQSHQRMTVSSVQILQLLVLAALFTNGHQRRAIYLAKPVLATISKRTTSIGGQMVPHCLG